MQQPVRPTVPQQEPILWYGKPSQLTNLHWFLLALVAVVAAIYFRFWWGLLAPIPLAGIPALITASYHYTLTPTRILVTHGVLVRQRLNCELYRIKDFKIVEPLLLRMFNLGHVELVTSEADAPNFTLQAIANPDQAADLIRHQVETRRQEMNIFIGEQQ